MILLFGFINYMIGNNLIIGFISGIFVGVNYHTVLRPYTTMVEDETKKKFEEIYHKINENKKKED